MRPSSAFKPSSLFLLLLSVPAGPLPLSRGGCWRPAFRRGRSVAAGGQCLAGLSMAVVPTEGDREVVSLPQLTGCEHHSAATYSCVLSPYVCPRCVHRCIFMSPPLCVSIHVPVPLRGCGCCPVCPAVSFLRPLSCPFSSLPPAPTKGCPDKAPQSGGLKKQQFILTLVEARCPKPSCRQDECLLETLREKPSRVPLSLWCRPESVESLGLWPPASSLCLFSRDLLCVCVQMSLV